MEKLILRYENKTGKKAKAEINIGGTKFEMWTDEFITAISALVEWHEKKEHSILSNIKKKLESKNE